jgi:hypothetical protein
MLGGPIEASIPQDAGPAPAQRPDAAAGLSRRLDDFDGQVQQLRKAVEELTRALKDKK